MARGLEKEIDEFLQAGVPERSAFRNFVCQSGHADSVNASLRFLVKHQAFTCSLKEDLLSEGCIYFFSPKWHAFCIPVMFME
jgi:hypothetical protein